MVLPVHLFPPSSLRSAPQHANTDTGLCEVRGCRQSRAEQRWIEMRLDVDRLSETRESRGSRYAVKQESRRRPVGIWEDKTNRRWRKVLTMSGCCRKREWGGWGRLWRDDKGAWHVKCDDYFQWKHIITMSICISLQHVVAGSRMRH